MRIVNRGTRLHKATWAEHMWQKTPNELTVTWNRNGIEHPLPDPVARAYEHLRRVNAELGRMGIL